MPRKPRKPSIEERTQLLKEACTKIRDEIPGSKIGQPGEYAPKSERTPETYTCVYIRELCFSVHVNARRQLVLQLLGPEGSPTRQAGNIAEGILWLKERGDPQDLEKRKKIPRGETYCFDQRDDTISHTPTPDIKRSLRKEITTVRGLCPHWSIDITQNRPYGNGRCSLLGIEDRDLPEEESAQGDATPGHMLWEMIRPACCPGRPAGANWAAVEEGNRTAKTQQGEEEEKEEEQSEHDEEKKT